MLYLIAFLHAVPVLVIGLASGSRSRSISSAIFMACLGVLTGNPAYIAIDLIAVGLALWFCLENVSERQYPKTEPRSSVAWVSLDGREHSIEQKQEHQLFNSKNHSPGESGGDKDTDQTRETSEEQQMGLLSAMRLSSLYDKRIRAYGLEPRSLPPDLHSTICSSFERRAERFAAMSQLSGGARRDFIEASIEAAADLVVLCGIGPEPYDDMRIGQRASEVIEELARTWIKDGPEGSIELQAMQAVNQSGNLNADFTSAFKSERAWQRQVSIEHMPAVSPKTTTDSTIESADHYARLAGYADHSARLLALRMEIARRRTTSIPIIVKRPK